VNRTFVPAAVVVLWALVAVFGPLLPLQPNSIDLTMILAAPGKLAWFGTDDLGRAVFDRLVVGARTSFVVALSVVLVSLVLGTFIGTLSAWVGGLFDHIVVRVIDVFLAFPGILLAIALAGILGPGIENVVLALSVVGWVGFARLARAQTLSVKQREHVLAAVALGADTPRVVRHHVLPYISAPLVIEATFGMSGTIVAEAGLSFLGLGVQPPVASWGSMIRDGTDFLLVAPHMVLAPCVALLVVVLSVNLLGDRLRDRLDVRSRFRD